MVKVSPICYKVLIYQNDSCNEMLPPVAINQENIYYRDRIMINNVTSIIDETAAYIAIQIFNELGSDMTEFMKLNLSGI